VESPEILAGAKEELFRYRLALHGQNQRVVLLRHIHEHLDQYIAGTGNQRSQLPQDFNESAIGLLDDGPAYLLGGKLFVVSEIVTAAEALAETVGRCLGDGPLE
jgi:hypothetical protein